MNANNISEKIINISIYDRIAFYVEPVNLSDKMIFNFNGKVVNSNHPLPIAFFLFDKLEHEDELMHAIAFKTDLLDVKYFKIIIV